VGAFSDFQIPKPGSNLVKPGKLVPLWRKACGRVLQKEEQANGEAREVYPAFALEA
jgi:hypothetical protein